MKVVVNVHSSAFSGSP